MSPFPDRLAETAVSRLRLLVERARVTVRTSAAAGRAWTSRRKPSGPHALLWAGVTSIAALAAALLVWASAPAAVTERPSPSGSTSGSTAGSVVVGRAPPTEAPKPSDSRIAPQAPDLGPYRIRPPYIILDGVTFGPEQARPTRLAGLVAPPATAVCFDRAGQLWACGLQARAALSRLISKREVECVPSRDPGRDVVEATCRLDETDLGRSLLEQGFARTAAPGGALAEFEATARKAETGLWNGGWRVR